MFPSDERKIIKTISSSAVPLYDQFPVLESVNALQMDYVVAKAVTDESRSQLVHAVPLTISSVL